MKLILNINIESPVVSITRRPGSPELLVGHLGQIFIQNFVAGDDDSRSDRLQVEIKDIKLYSLNCTQLAGRDNAGPEVNRTFCPPSGLASVNSQEEAHFTRHDFFESLHRGQGEKQKHVLSVCKGSKLSSCICVPENNTVPSF